MRNAIPEAREEMIVGRKRSPPRIAVLIASHDNVPVTFAYDLSLMLTYTASELPEGAELGIQLAAGTYVHEARQDLIVSALEDRVTHMLWLDADMRFPRDTLVRLLVHNVPVVGANYATRGVPSDFVAIKKVNWNPDEPGERLYTGPDSTGLEEVEAVGMGVLLTRADAFQSMPDPRVDPWFFFQKIPGKDGGFRLLGEDVYFCKLLREAGNRILVDHDLSQDIAHTGQFDFKTIHATVEYAGRRLEEEGTE